MLKANVAPYVTSSNDAVIQIISIVPRIEKAAVRDFLLNTIHTF